MNKYDRLYETDLEEKIISYILYYPNEWINIVNYLSIEDFTSAKLRIIFNALSDLMESTKTFDINLLINELSRTNKLQQAGGEQYILSLSLDEYVVEAEIIEYIKKISEATKLRKILEIFEQSKKEISQGKKLSDDIIDEFQEKMNQIISINAKQDFDSIAQVAQDLLTMLRNQQYSYDIKGITTGFDKLNHMTSGLQKGDLIILAARPSMGKTAFALNLAKNACDAKKNVVFFSLEMSSQQLVARLLSLETMIDASIFKKPGALTKDHWIRIKASIDNKINKYNLLIEDSGTIKLNEMIWKLQRLKRKKEQIDLIIIDYLQLINSSSKTRNENRQVEVSIISRKLKQLARELDTPIIALSQLSREVEKREKKTPQLSDLRESGSIEQDADIVMFLHRESYYASKKTNDNIQDSQLIIAKHRNGPIGEISMSFDLATGNFFEKSNSLQSFENKDDYGE
ncbi:replicative DNA helicase [Mesomycoplasma hyorhinis]|uniref:Replicative DNA helicase n=3 Tax=Mesomycoplasma hyorhinis TaxID=2100 RepID=A0AAJ2YNW2_MESHY|nr:replicative DNA helicase [Mesomycoplasma hyorhinis]ADM21704.1 Replicative helicase DnaB [Mesomycoplasma hyorhinis HUB-1]AEC45723.1 Replicative helicase DnaB [Mesomycoplasma hyorhinis MCLD]AEX14125.1 replicative DNA helicase [Mesomycoplasma hyorhinis GDL-1]AHA41119.1 replicative DNA helicase [Mesomycoplasma hyorhinis DBS 1050]AOD25353.1 Replicative helicase DnaB [Mesomycoplasma hyorhinis]